MTHRGTIPGGPPQEGEIHGGHTTEPDRFGRRPGGLRHLTVPAEIRKWHAPGPDFTVCIAEVDPRPGGVYRVGMQPPGRVEPYTFYGVCREVNAPKRLIYTSRWEPPEREMGESLVTIEMRPRGNDTEVVVVHDLLPDRQAAEDPIRGWTGTLLSLVRHYGAGD